MDENRNEHEDFTVALALVDAIPVIFFSLSMIILATALSGSGIAFWIFLVGAILIAASGLCKVLWKLLLGLKVGDVKILNKAFVPCMAGGFMIAIIGAIIGTITGAIVWKGIIKAIISIPAIIFFIVGFCGMGVMGYVKSSQSREDFNKDAKKNWLAEFVNGFSQAMLFLGIFFATKG